MNPPPLRRRAIAGLVGLLALAGVAPAQPATAPATAPATRPTVDTLLRDLGADTFAARDRAQRDLIDLGPPARPAVEALAKGSPDPEIRSRAAAVLRGIERGEILGPTRVTLHLKDATPRAALQALATAAGVKLALKSPEWWKLRTGKVAFDADQEPFWPVFFRLTKVAGGDITFADGGGQLFVNPADPGISYPTCNSGPFAVQARGIKSADDRAIDFAAGQPSRDRTFEFHLGFCVEPKLVLASVADRPVATEATDERGHDLLTRHGTPGRQASRDATFWTSSLSLDADAAEGAKSIKHLKGFLHVEVADLARALTVAPLAAGATAEQQGIRLTVAKIDSNAESDTLFLRIAHPQGDPTANDLFQSIDLFDAAGLRLVGYVEDHCDDGRTLSVQFAFYRPKGVGPPVTLTWPLRAARRPVDVPFEFDNLPLP